MPEQFADPATPTGIDYQQLHRSLLMVEVLSYEDHVPTVHTKPGERNPAIRANVTVIDGPQAGHLYEDALVFPKVLQSQLRSRIGKTVLGRLVQGEAKPGQTAPWKMDTATEADKAAATNLLSMRASGTVAAASDPGAPPF